MPNENFSGPMSEIQGVCNQVAISRSTFVGFLGSLSCDGGWGLSSVETGP